MTTILGINAYHGDASAAAVIDGRLVAAAEEERFNRIKHAAGFPAEALRWVASAKGASPADVRILAVARDPWTLAALRPQQMLAQAFHDAGSILAGPAIQVRCIECGGMEAPRRLTVRDRSFADLLKAAIGL